MSRRRPNYSGPLRSFDGPSRGSSYGCEGKLPGGYRDACTPAPCSREGDPSSRQAVVTTRFESTNAKLTFPQFNGMSVYKVKRDLCSVSAVPRPEHVHVYNRAM